MKTNQYYTMSAYINEDLEILTKLFNTISVYHEFLFKQKSDLPTCSLEIQNKYVAILNQFNSLVHKISNLSIDALKIIYNIKRMRTGTHIPVDEQCDYKLDVTGNLFLKELYDYKQYMFDTTAEEFNDMLINMLINLSAIVTSIGNISLNSSAIVTTIGNISQENQSVLEYLNKAQERFLKLTSVTEMQMHYVRVI
jgi:hypothetical protein